MSFQVALSGLAAAQTELDVTGNNIANVATTGFKESRAEFTDIYATSIQDLGTSRRTRCPCRQGLSAVQPGDGGVYLQ